MEPGWFASNADATAIRSSAAALTNASRSGLWALGSAGKVVLADIEARALAETAAGLEAIRATALTVATDVSKTEQVDGLVGLRL